MTNATALLVFDMDKSMEDFPANPSTSAVQRNMIHLLKRFRNHPTSSVIFTDVSTTYDSCLEGCEPIDSDIVVHRDSGSSLFNLTNIDYILKTLSIFRLVIVGRLTEHNATETARSASSLGYSVTVAQDACLSHTLDSEESWWHHFDGFARVVETRDVLAELKESFIATDQRTLHEVEQYLKEKGYSEASQAVAKLGTSSRQHDGGNGELSSSSSEDFSLVEGGSSHDSVEDGVVLGPSFDTASWFSSVDNSIPTPKSDESPIPIPRVAEIKAVDHTNKTDPTVYPEVWDCLGFKIANNELLKSTQTDTHPKLALATPYYHEVWDILHYESPKPLRNERERQRMSACPSSVYQGVWSTLGYIVPKGETELVQGELETKAPSSLSMPNTPRSKVTESPKELTSAAAPASCPFYPGVWAFLKYRAPTTSVVIRQQDDLKAAVEATFYPGVWISLGYSTPDCSASSIESALCDVGLYGLAVMGQNFALNMAERGYSVCVGNRSQKKVVDTVKRALDEGDLTVVGSTSVMDFVSSLKTPRKIVVLVKAGKAVDETIAEMSRHMEPGDIIVDGGNEWFHNSLKRAEFLRPKGIHFAGMGISGGEEGARNGPSLMFGGPAKAYDAIEPILLKTAAKVDRFGACVARLGPIGSGNYVKMVHNGIEYGMMQIIAEVYDAMKNSLGLVTSEIAQIFSEWNSTNLGSYLIGTTSLVLRKREEGSNVDHVVDYILDKIGSKGTGKWTVSEGVSKEVAIPTIAAALDARVLSCLKNEREVAATLIAEPNAIAGSLDQSIKDLKEALFSATICCFSQGLCLIKAASDEYQWDVDLSECARLWMGGCIIRANLLEDIQHALAQDNSLSNLLLHPDIADKLNARSSAWRRAVSHCIADGIACPALASSLSYMDTYRRRRLPAYLTQAQRDFFGGHTYERVDQDGRFHTTWTRSHKDIGDIDERITGEDFED